MATAHLICGLPCAGKTTYAKGLCRQTGAVRFWLDYWLITLFGAYTIESIGHAEHVRRVTACRKVIWSIASGLLQKDVDVVLDDGFFLREHRRQYVEMCDRLGADVKIHFLNTPMDVIRSRLQERNARLPQYNFEVTPERLQSFAELFEAPTDNEGAEVFLIDSESGAGRRRTRGDT